MALFLAVWLLTGGAAYVISLVLDDGRSTTENVLACAFFAPIALVITLIGLFVYWVERADD